MKKVYINPQTKVTAIELRSHLLDLSLQTGQKATSGTTVLTREENSWDIWGNEYDDYED